MSDSDSDSGNIVRRVYGIRKPKATNLYQSREQGQRVPRFNALASKIAKSGNNWGDSDSDDDYTGELNDFEKDVNQEIHNRTFEARNEKVNQPVSDGEQKQKEGEADKTRPDSPTIAVVEAPGGTAIPDDAFSAQSATAPATVAFSIDKKTNPTSLPLTPKKPEPEPEPEPESKEEEKHEQFEKGVKMMEAEIDKKMPGFDKKIMGKIVKLYIDVIQEGHIIDYGKLDAEEKQKYRERIAKYKSQFKRLIEEARTKSGGSASSTAEIMRIIRKRLVH